MPFYETWGVSQRVRKDRDVREGQSRKKENAFRTLFGKRVWRSRTWQRSTHWYAESREKAWGPQSQMSSSEPLVEDLGQWMSRPSMKPQVNLCCKLGLKSPRTFVRIAGNKEYGSLSLLGLKNWVGMISIVIITSKGTKQKALQEMPWLAIRGWALRVWWGDPVGNNLSPPPPSTTTRWDSCPAAVGSKANPGHKALLLTLGLNS
jgi:hypothetical protein